MKVSPYGTGHLTHLFPVTPSSQALKSPSRSPYSLETEVTTWRCSTASMRGPLKGSPQNGCGTMAQRTCNISERGSPHAIPATHWNTFPYATGPVERHRPKTISHVLPYHSVPRKQL